MHYPRTPLQGFSDGCMERTLALKTFFHCSHRCHCEPCKGEAISFPASNQLLDK